MMRWWFSRCGRLAGNWHSFWGGALCGAPSVDLNTSLKRRARSGAEKDGGLHLRRHSLRGLLIVSELTLSLMLLIGAGLLIRSFVRLQSVPPGFTTDHVLTMEVAATGPKYRADKAVINFYKEFESRVAHLPGVVAEGVVSALPLTGEVGWGQINVEGYAPPLRAGVASGYSRRKHGLFSGRWRFHCARADFSPEDG